MNLVIVALNSKYTHTSLSVRCLYNAVKDISDCSFKEYTINDSVDDVCMDLYAQNPHCVAFSCYIWNIEFVLKTASLLKKANPNIKIVLGGHEAEHDGINIILKNPFVDAVLHGEGEISLKIYVKYLMGQIAENELESVTYKKGEEIIETPVCAEKADLNALPFVYDETIEEIKNKIIYYETSRGCPYNCTYCISGEGHSVRFLDVERVKKELTFFMEHKVPLVKFVDRTFNADKKRAKEIFSFIADNPSDTCFHMELSGDLMDEETVAILSRAKKGSMQFEIGVQSTHGKTLDAVERKMSLERLKTGVKELLTKTDIHIHLDLIAGLPYEDINTFKNSFNEVIALNPHVLQLGFLKLLKGSKIRSNDELHGYKYKDFPPYEIICNNYISYGDILTLKNVEEALERYYNSGSFKCSLKEIFKSYPDAYEVFLKIGNHFKTLYPTGYAFSKQKLYDILYECFKDIGKEFMYALKKDYLMSFRPGKRPYWFDEPDTSLTQKVYEMFKDEELKKEKFPCYFDVPAKEIMKHIHGERFGDVVLLFDYREEKVYDVTGYLKADN